LVLIAFVQFWTQAISSPETNNVLFSERTIVLIFWPIGASLIIIEAICYIILYRYMWIHNNNMGHILNPNVIKSRNRVNAISLTGLFATWLIEVGYNFFGAFLSVFIKDGILLSEVVSSMIPFEYYLIPLIQIYTTANLKSFKDNQN